MLTVRELKDILADAIEQIEDFDDDAEVKTVSNTYFVKGNNVLGTYDGFLSLSDIEVIDDYDDDEEFNEDDYDEENYDEDDEY